jgi:tetratricopeptide (TPR) repeat protein
LSLELLELIQLKGSSASEEACNAMGVLGTCYMDLLRYAEATAVHKQQLEIARKIESLEEEADALYHLAAVGARDGSLLDSYETIRLAIRLLDKSKNNDMKRVTMPHYQFFYGAACSFIMQIGQWHKFRMYKKTGVLIGDGFPGLNQALGTQTPGKDCLHEGLAGSCCVPVCVGAVVYMCTE